MKLFTWVLVLFCVSINAQDQKVENSKIVEEGYQLVKNRTKGNCLACHMIQGEESPGYFGPPLLAMKSRFPDSKVLYDQIWDATQLNPSTSMPPFGKHMILSEIEIEKIVNYLLTL